MRSFWKRQGDCSGKKRPYSGLLGRDPRADEAYYVGLGVRDQEVALDPIGHSVRMMGPVGYSHVNGAKEIRRSPLGAGTQMQQGVKDVGEDTLIAVASDVDNIVVGLI